ncbi:Gamma-soluble NSF attachment protein [Abeliophyllum distichum]|uniref:Gamma-soluble NSF attachment protein n=1 Tax=Abeliophyllum distichum TaxID=126358 RepID=A0ABD1RU61_9LAMI
MHHLYEHVANAYRLVKNYEEAKEAFEKDSKRQQMLSSPCHAAKHMEYVGVLAKECARALEDVTHEEAIQLYTNACDALEEDGKEQMAFDLYHAATIVYIKLEKYADAATFLLRCAISADKCNAIHSQCKAYLSAIIVYLYAHDFQ